MKSVLIVSILSIITAFSAYGQVHPHALGIRAGGGNHGNGAEISYQMGMGDANRLELDLGFRSRRNTIKYNNGIGNAYGNAYQVVVLSGVYHWNWNIVEGLNWYVGPGAQIGYWEWKDNYYGESGLIFGIGGQIGIEYDFSVHGAPILLGLDSRPMWGFYANDYGYGYGAALSIRYIFQ